MIPLRSPVSPPEPTPPPSLRLVPKPAGTRQAPFGAELNQPRPEASAVAEAVARVSAQSGPKKETARMSTLSEALPASAVLRHARDIVAPSNSIDAFDFIPSWFCWGLLSLSTIIFLIQIWNYALS